MRLVKVEIQEQKPSLLVEHDNGIEAVSNDGTMKIILRKVNLFVEGAARDIYATLFYIKEGNAWIKTSESHTYNTKEEFIKALRETEEFYKAVDEYDNIHK